MTQNTMTRIRCHLKRMVCHDFHLYPFSSHMLHNSHYGLRNLNHSSMLRNAQKCPHSCLRPEDSLMHMLCRTSGTLLGHRTYPQRHMQTDMMQDSMIILCYIVFSCWLPFRCTTCNLHDTLSMRIQLPHRNYHHINRTQMHLRKH